MLDLRRGVRLTSFGPKAMPFDVALRCGKDNNVPQIQFNEDGVWHNEDGVWHNWKQHYRVKL